MPNNQPPRASISTWILLLIIGLILESCILAVIAGIFLSRRGEIDLPSLGQEPLFPAATSSPALEINEAGDPTTTQVAESLPTVAVETTSPIMPKETEPAEYTPTTWDFPPTGKIVYVCFDGAYDQICLMNADGSGKIQLTDSASTNFYPSLSSDGELILFSSNRDGNFEIYRINTDGTDVQQLTDGLGNLYAPELSPNNNRIVFTHETGGRQDIWIMRADGENARPLTDSGSDIDPTWSPDGEQIAFTSARNGPKQIFTMNVSGQKPRPVQIPNGPKVGGRLSWSPDGNWLAFYGGPSGDRNIYRVSLDGRNLIQLTQGGDNLGPSYSLDGAWLAFTSFRDGNNEVYVMQIDGTSTVRLTTAQSSDWQPRWGR